MMFRRCLRVHENFLRLILSPKKYKLSEIPLMNKLFVKIIDTCTHNMVKIVQRMKFNLNIIDGRNFWFGKAAVVLALNSCITVEKSFWRLKYNSGLVQNKVGGI